MKSTLNFPTFPTLLLAFAFIILLLITPGRNFAQTLFNGSFETNTAGANLINLSNPAFNSTVPNTFAFGTFGDMDVITTAIYCGLPQNGNWYVALTGDGTDAFSMKLTSPLIAGSNYILTFYDHGCGSPYSTGPCPVQIGTSATNNSMGTIVGTMPVPNPGIWTQRTLVFTAPPNANYITIQLVGGGLQNWTQVDNFVISQQSLPIELTSFLVFRDNDYNHLEWTTASELNNDYFDLENSTDGMQFKHLATINGSGNSTELRMYTYNDYFPINGTNYYRLRQVDYDGNFSYSPIVTSLNKKNGRLDFVCHSDRSGNLIILFESRSEFENIRISVMDMTGKELISSCARQDSRVEIPHTIALSGIYIVEISDGETISRKKLMIGS